MTYAYKNRSAEKSKRRRSTRFNKMWIGRDASEKTLIRYCMEIWSDLIKTIDNNKCFMCGSKEYLNSHHLISKKWTKTAFNTNCGITLCKNCHDNNIYSAHISPWILEKKLREQRPEQYRWYLINRAEVGKIDNEKYDYKLILDKLLKEFELISPLLVQRSNYFKYSMGEEKQIVHEFTNLDAPTKMIAKKWGCSYAAINSILRRHGISIVSSKSKKRNKEMMQRICGHKVLKLDKNGDVLAEFVSMNEAARQHGLVINSIRNCTKGYTKTAGGFRWIYKKDVEGEKNLEKNK